MNLAAPYLCKFFADPNLNVMQYIDVLFGNESEAATFSKLMNIEASDLKEMALKVCQLPKKNAKRKRMVVFTQGKDPTVVAYEGKAEAHPVTPIEKNLIKDTNGCGDSFVGGFLSQLVQGKSIDDCLRCGSYAAKIVIQQWGCTYPPKPEFK